MGAQLSSPDVSLPPDRTFLITGANTGIGYVTAKKIAQLGGRVVITCRTEEKAKEAIARMQRENEEEFQGKQAADAAKGGTAPTGEPKGSSKVSVTDKKDEEGGNKKSAKEEKVEDTNKEQEAKGGETTQEKAAEESNKVGAAQEQTEGANKEGAVGGKEDDEKKEKTSIASPLNLQYMTLDLSSIASTLEFVEKYKSSNLPLHVLICNAGIYLSKREITDDGYESHFQVNYLSHLLLTLHLLPLMKSAPNGRIINLSAEVHRFNAMDMANLQSEKYFSASRFCGNSKLFQIMSMHTLSNKLKDEGIGIFCVHPGGVATDIFRNTTGASKVFFNYFMRLGFARTPEKGALTTLVAALDPAYDDKTAIYFSSCKPANASALSRNKEMQEKVWRYSLECLRDYLTDDLLNEVGEKMSDIAEVNHTVPQPAQEAKPAAGDAEPTAGDAELIAGDSEQTAGDAEPTAGDSEPAAGDSEPTAGDSELTVGDAKPETSEPTTDGFSGEKGPST